MKRAATITALATATLALAGCMQPVQFEAAPETMPAIEAKDMPSTQPAVHNGPWTADDVKVSGATPELKADAQKALDSHVSYYDGMVSGKYRQHLYSVNVGGVDRWLNIIEAKSDNVGSVELVLDSDLNSAALEPVTSDVACSLVRFGLKDKDAVSWLKSLKLTSAENGDSFTFTDISWCG